MAATGRFDQDNAALDAACRVLVLTGEPASVAGVAVEAGRDEATTDAGLARAECDGRLRRNGAGEVVAAAGISVVPSDVEVHVGGRRMWAWCVKTAFGMVGALGAGGAVLARSPASGAQVRVEFEGSAPLGTECAVFWPSDQYRSSCSSAVDEYCPTFGLFESAAAAREWAVSGSVPGEVIDVVEAAERARPQYAASLDTAAQRGRLVSALTGPAPAAR